VLSSPVVTAGHTKSFGIGHPPGETDTPDTLLFGLLGRSDGGLLSSEVSAVLASFTDRRADGRDEVLGVLNATATLIVVADLEDRKFQGFHCPRQTFERVGMRGQFVSNSDQ
jgi:hypothetical protein